MWVVYWHEDTPQVGFTVGDGTEKACIKYCRENEDYTYCYYSCY